MKALIAMSGGVDSSVSAYLMKQAGYECVGCTMRLYDNEMIGEDLHSTCCSLKDTRDARAVTVRLGIPYYIFRYEDLFREEVIEPFVRSYEEGRTPNPCIECNRVFKFGHLLRQMESLGLDCVVTGHYARIERSPENGRMLLKKGLDAAKDQSYVLYTMTQKELENTRFPLGTLTKEEVRKIAEEQGFLNARKHDSQDICFVPDGDYAGFMERFRGMTYPEGDFIDREGHVLGRHKGFVRYTVGQRRGLGIPAEHPLYVLEVRPRDNTVVLGNNEDLFTTVFYADRVNWIAVEALHGPMRVKAKIRYRHKEQPATVFPAEDGKVRVVFDEAQRAITPGQAAVFYQDDTVVGGGVII